MPDIAKSPQLLQSSKRVRIINPYRDLVLDGLVGWWPLDDGSGTSARDASGNGRTMSLPDTDAGDWESGPLGGGVAFDGSTEYGAVDHNSALNPGGADYSLSLWMKSTATLSSSSNIYALINKGHYDGDSEFELMLRGGTTYNGIYFRIRATSVEDTYPSVDYSSTLVNGSWHHLAVIIDEGGSPEVTLYLDGSSIATRATITQSVNTTRQFLAARYTIDIGTYFWFPGSLADIRVYNRALTAGEVAAIAAGRG